MSEPDTHGSATPSFDAIRTMLGTVAGLVCQEVLRVLRIHFTPESPEEIHHADQPDAMWEILLSLHALQERADTGDSRWRARVAEGMTGPMRRLAHLTPPRGYSPDFLTPLSGPGGVEQGLDAVLATPPSRLRRDLALLARQQHRSTTVRGLLREGPTALRPVAAAMRSYYELALAPEWERLGSRMEHNLASGPGTAGAPREIPPPLRASTRWQGWVLTIAYPVSRDLSLAGRPLYLIPSFFCRRYPIALHDPGLTPVVVYPAVHTSVVPVAPSVEPQRRTVLARLLGGTRAAVFEAIAHGCTTTELARRLDISPASASEHTAVLRDAGLVRSQRRRNTVYHQMTELGYGLLLGERN
ncbi:ArsR/SmtB family transcription factor [Salinactinospora qingdaonensis]|uniref:Winged helix-turn-helix domain-containing protein n=1 Tax=Salinactinospora qingdaonensis TaxID=702744 RepID=A0ABP7G5C4_9ACTN